ncbi:DUF6456 domain-containing protein [Methylopila musalis]|uniref:DUF6456 domain-containing protein n=1 Tax=Methylopila musalis TaxID=1134781 RepID=UPI003670E98F
MPPAAAAELEQLGLIAREGAGWRVTDPGRSRVAREQGGTAGFLAQHRTLGLRSVEAEGVSTDLLVDLDESPLAWLARRKGKDGRPLLGAHEVLAGERLRADFIRGQMTPRVTSNWSGAAGGRRAGPGVGADLSDAALAARLRVSRALEAVGPELSGALLDVCCCLKGLEEVERERGWPARGGKLVLGLALASLARHYGYADAAVGPDSRGAPRVWTAPE